MYQMKKIKFSEDEWYPVFSMLPDDSKWGWEFEADLSELEIKEFGEIHEKFEQWQRRLRRMRDLINYPETGLKPVEKKD